MARKLSYKYDFEKQNNLSRKQSVLNLCCVPSLHSAKSSFFECPQFTQGSFIYKIADIGHYRGLFAVLLASVEGTTPYVHKRRLPAKGSFTSGLSSNSRPQI